MNIYRECGYPLLMESIKQGSRFITEFFDPKIKDHAEKITSCPCCQQQFGKIIHREISAWSNACYNTN